MPQKHASRKQSDEKEPRIPEVEVILGLPESSRIVTPKSGKAANKVSDSFEGFIVEVDWVAQWKRLAQVRKGTKSPSTEPGKEFVALWDRHVRLLKRLHEVIAYPQSEWTPAEILTIVSDGIEAGSSGNDSSGSSVARAWNWQSTT